MDESDNRLHTIDPEQHAIHEVIRLLIKRGRRLRLEKHSRPGTLDEKEEPALREAGLCNPTNDAITRKGVCHE